MKLRKPINNILHLKEFKVHTCCMIKTLIKSSYVTNIRNPIYCDVEKFKSKDGQNQLLTISYLYSSYHEVYKGLSHLKAQNCHDEKPLIWID